MLADGELSRAAHVVEQLARGPGLPVGLAEVLERGHGQRRDDAEDRDDGEQFDQRERGKIADVPAVTAGSA